MVKRKILTILLGLSVCLFCTGLIYGWSSVSVTNNFETGIVNISLSEYQKVGDSEVLFENKEHILPGDIISKIPRIQNDGNDCYVRARITFRGVGNDVNENHLLGIGSDWIKADDGYYYYTKVLPYGETVDLFQALKIPEDFSQDYEEEIFDVDIDVDAIQSKNFTPVFELAKPWGDIEILKCEKEGQYDVSTFKQSDNQSFVIQYLGDSKKLVVNSEDFFENFPYLMPGDTYSDTATIRNTSGNQIKLYFRSEALDDSELIDKILLKITTKINGKETLVYEGNLRAEEISKDGLLGVIPVGGTGDFNFEITVPAELNNQYSILSSSIRWIFSVNPIEEVDNVTPPQTGDTSQIDIYIIIMVVSAFLGWLALFGLKKEKEREADKNE